MIQQQFNISNLLRPVLDNGQALLIIPPFGSIYDVALGPHILQAEAEAKGFKTHILYINMLFASLLGLEQYDLVHNAPLYWMLGERLFARSAYELPPLGYNAHHFSEEFMPVGGKKTGLNAFYQTHTPLDKETALQMENQCHSFIEEIAPIIASSSYPIIGCGILMFRQINFSIALLHRIKQLNPEKITIIGGIGCKEQSAEGIASLHHSIDYIFKGESETSFTRFLQDCFPSRGNSIFTDSLPPQRIIIGEPNQNLDNIPVPGYKSFFEQYHHFIGNTNQEKIRVWYETSRGCWWAEKSKCTFCSEFPFNFRHKSVDKVLYDLRFIKPHIGERLLYMSDNIIEPSYPEKLLPQMASSPDFPSLVYQLRTNFDLDTLSRFKQSKIPAIFAGIETFSSHVLKLMHKGTFGRQNLLFLRNAACAGIYTTWFLLWGFPGETDSDNREILQILPLIRHLQPPMSYIPLGLMRHSQFIDHPQNFGITSIEPWPVFADIFPKTAAIEKLAIYYAGEYSSGSEQSASLVGEIAHQVEYWKQNWKKENLALMNVLGTYAIIDTRSIHKTEKKHFLTEEKACQIMIPKPYKSCNDSPDIKWAIDEKLAVIMDSWYIPLITASPTLISNLEKVCNEYPVS